MAAAYSSSALCVNAFARWRNDVADLEYLELAGVAGFHDFEFEAVRPTGLRGTPPHLDLFASGSELPVAVESKCTEYLQPKPAAFREVFAADNCANPTWAALYEQLRGNPLSFTYLDAAQLCKHYLGLKNAGRKNASERPVTLLYLHWEPANAAEYGAFAAHRAEVDRLAANVSDAEVTFDAMSYPELWSKWEQQAEPIWLDHVAGLRRRYGVRV